jgi:GNAT superfamily N-acetyltransferase
MAKVTIRPYRWSDEAALVEAWCAALPLDLVDAATFRRKVLLDPNFDPAGLLVADDGGELAGICLGLVRRVPFEGVGLEPERGWITAFGVRPELRRQGFGSALLEAGLARFRNGGRSQVLLAPYLPNYFVPGVDAAAYADGLAFLTKRGFQVTSRPLAMDASLVTLDLSPYLAREAALRDQGIEVRRLRLEEIPRLLEFLAATMPGDWLRHARELLHDAVRGKGDPEPFVAALAGGRMVGYCQHEAEHFGPFGVAEGWQGRGIGTVLLARCLELMRRKGLHNAWVLWTSDEAAARVYSRFGFTETRRFAVLRREL